MNTDFEDVAPVRMYESGRKDNDGLHKRRGIWAYKLQINGKWREFSTGTRNYQDARRIFATASREHEEGRLSTDLARLPFAKIAEKWLADRKNVVAPKTLRTEQERMKPVLATFGAKRVCEFTPEDVRKYQNDRAVKVSPKTVNLETGVLRLVLKSARQWARIADDYKPLRLNRRGPGRALTEEEENRLFSMASSKPAWEVAFLAGLLAANTGMRSKEVRVLRLQDVVDLLERILHVRRESTKTDAGCRNVPLNDQALWAASRLLARAHQIGAHLPEHFVFPACCFKRTKGGVPSAGAGFDPSQPMKGWRTAWRSLTREAGLPGLRFHDLRHGFITKHLENGTPEHTLMAIVGHVSREMLEHYSHTRNKAKQEAVARVQVDFTPAEQWVPKVVQ